MRSLVAFLLATGALVASANPIPSPDQDMNLAARDLPCIPCREEVEYTITHQYNWKDSPRLIKGFSCNGACSLEAGHEYSTGVTVEIGANLGLSFKDIFSAGISTSVSYSTSVTTTTGASVDCPEGVLCGLLHQDAIQVVQGYRTCVSKCSSGQRSCGTTRELSSDHFTANFPCTGDNGTPITALYICGCPDSDLSRLPSGMYTCPEACLQP
jgi:hypothetical protein